jgi:predicted lipoprotein with Yx(FWY)xxD motif/uncharacterized cupredoxin-like copper-binding protein
MKRTLLVVIPLLLVSMARLATAQASPTVTTKQDSHLGTILADRHGMTVYRFAKDTTKGESACYDQCAQNWPPVTASGSLTLASEVPGVLGTITRKDGSHQVTYNDIPLYYFAQDKDAADVYGQGVGGVWFVVTPGQQFGAPAASPVASPVASPMASPMAAETVVVTLNEYTITPAITTFKVGQPYTFVVKNVGTITHEMVLEPAGVDDEPLEINGHESEVENVDPGQTKSMTWTFTSPGEYQMACHVKGHYEAGMVVKIHVTA